MKLSIVIPAYNEEKRIKKTLTTYTTHFASKMGDDFEIIVVCDGCVDKTSDIVKEFSRSYKNVRCLELPERRGKGGGVMEGFKVAKGNIVGFVDADDAFEINGIEKLIQLVDSEYDCAIASKWKGKNFLQVTEPFFRKVASRGWNMILRMLLGIRVHDAQAGAKFLKHGVLDSVLPIRCTGFEFDAELLWRIHKNGFSIEEIYIPSRHEEYSKFKMIQSLKMLTNILKARFNI